MPSLVRDCRPIVRGHRSHIEDGRTFDDLLWVIRRHDEDVPKGRRMAGSVLKNEAKVAAEHDEAVALPNLFDTVVVFLKLGGESADILHELIRPLEGVVRKFNDDIVRQIMARAVEVLL